ncbi:MAG: hypothetical protein KBS70_08280 [Bacteroidales bacterium]|nr:hypothetical protein [Candidatus Colicola equi]
MKTIAEINEIAPYHPCEWQQGYGIWQSGYMEGQKNGAAEQKAIDEDAMEAIVEESAIRVTEMQKAIDIEKACEMYEKELRQMKRILNEVKDGAGELISVGGSLIQFRKAMEE